jgi:YD repeat-containing protein
VADTIQDSSVFPRASFSSPALNTLQAQFSELSKDAGHSLGEYNGHVGAFPVVEPVSGTLYAMLTPPVGGLFDPFPQFFYAGKSPAASTYGYGWNCTWDRTLVQVSSTVVNVVVASGTSFVFSGKDVSGYYTPASGLSSSVQESGSGWNEVTDTGTKYVANGSDSRWTVTRDGGGRINFISDPFLRRTSFAYDGSNKIRRLTDPANRITSFVVDGSGELTKFTRPDGNRTTMAYDGNHRLTGWAGLAIPWRMMAQPGRLPRCFGLWGDGSVSLIATSSELSLSARSSPMHITCVPR